MAFSILHICRIIMLGLILFPSNEAEYNMPLQAIEKMAEVFGQTIYETCAQATALTDLRTDYLLMEPDVQPLDGHRLAMDVKHSIEELLRRKMHAVQKLVHMAELSHARHIFDPDLKITYPESKKLNATEFELVKSEHFNNISVNLTMSTVHVPTSVYDQSADVLNGVAWSEALDHTFQKNFENDSGLTWQYFCSTSGFFRIYPGTIWHRDRSDFLRPDVFDCRLRKWYIEAATTPKDIVILLDLSDSMKGQNIEIAKETSKLILDTLADDDFFNVITFSDVPTYLDSCSNRTLINSNTANKRRMMTAIDQTTTGGSSVSHDLALTEAFELLSATNLSSQGALCNRAVMLITDGISDTFDELFMRYNQPEFQVRIFTYLIGTSKAEVAKKMKAIACDNKGYFSHIRTLVGVHEHIQDYIHVLSRPLVIERPDHTVWTNVYDDTVGLDLVVTVAKPVYDVSDNPGSSGRLLGVVGADVKISEIQDVVKRFMLGVNAYAFAITNNGYVMFHPDLRPKHKNALNPYYDMVDLYKVEQSPKVRELVEKMLDRDTGHMHAKTTVVFDEMKRILVKDRHYFFTDIHRTPYSIALSLPNGYGSNWTSGKKQLHGFDLSALRTSELTIAPWNYCRMDSNEQNQNSVEMLIKYLNQGQSGGAGESLYKERCNDQLVQNFLFDAEATRGAYSSWVKENWDDNSNDIGSVKKSGVERVFIGTKGGLTRHMPLSDNLSDPDFINKHKSTIDSMYYKRAVDNGEEMFTFSITFDAGKKIDWEKLVVTGSTPIFVNKDSHEAVVATVGLQMKFSTFFQIFMNSSQGCTSVDDKCKTCSSEAIDCYLIDHNGYVVLSENSKELGQFYGELDGSASILMKELLMNETSIKKGVFKRLQNNDYQGVCEILKKSSSGTHAVLVTPFKLLLESIISFLHKMSIFLINFNVYSCWPGCFVTVNGNVTEMMTADPETISFPGAEDIDSDSLESLLDDLMKVASVEQVFRWKDECIRKTSNGDSAFLCLKDIMKLYEPGVIGYKPCIKSYTHYIAEPMQLPQVGILINCDTCPKSYSINNIPRTNLMLLAVDSLCYCNSEPAMNMKPVEHNYNDSISCLKMQEERYRQRPVYCYSQHPQENLITECGHAPFLVHPSFVTMMLLQLLSLLYVVVC